MSPAPTPATDCWSPLWTHLAGGGPIEDLPLLQMAGLAWHEVSRAASSVRNQRPELTEPVAPMD